jgi:SSS family solute:Na+ symporter/sodium/pantothenate symporter
MASALLLAAAAPPPTSPYILVAFGAYMAGVFLLGILSHHLLDRGSFLKEYFLGDRKLNAWVLAMTYVATSVSAGSLVGFPSLIYTNGWVMALWIAGYMISGMTTKGVLAKRLNQVSRISGSITVPDVLRDRFKSPALGLFAGIFLLLFLIFNLVAQFKAGGMILRQASEGVRDNSAYVAVRSTTVRALEAVGAWNEKEAEAQDERNRQEGKQVKSQYDTSYPDYVIGILIFSLTVVAYTTYGGFWAVTWTDVLQGIIIVAGALLLMVLSMHRVGGLSQATTRLQQIDSRLLEGPGPNSYLPLGLAISFFFLWTIGAMGQPVGMVRLMACRDTPTLRRSLFMIGLFYALIYLPLVITFICARAMFPTELLGDSDRVMPAIALTVTEDWPLLGGLILAAPYAAAMSAVAGFLLLMSSSLVRDIYQRNFQADISPKLVKRISYGTTAVVGIIVTIAALRPPKYLQHLIVFTGAGMGSTFLAPTVLALYWRRATRPGALAALFGGFATVSLLYLLGWGDVGHVKEALTQRGMQSPLTDAAAPFYLLGLDPVVYGLAVSFSLGILVSLLTQPPAAEEVDPFFVADARTSEVPSA